MTGAYGASAAREAADAVRRRAPDLEPRVGIILGSGLGGLARQVEHAVTIPFEEIPGFPAATVVGHAGTLILGTLEDVPVAALAGRFHMYEGHEAALAAFPTRVLHALGARTLLVSNAAGGINRAFRPGDLMLIRDHINLAFRNPLVGAVEDGDARFPDMSAPYDESLRDVARAAAVEAGVALQDGVYAWLLGPSYETRTEVRMLGALGADAAGMSTVPEVVVARALGMRVLGLSCITNMACGLSPMPITHEEVLATTAAVASSFERLVRAILHRGSPGWGQTP